MPARELADGALILVGGTLLLTPGFVTDIFGFFCVLPFTRPVARRMLTRLPDPQVPRRSGSSGLRAHVGGTPPEPGRDNAPDPMTVVQGEVVD